MNPIVVIFAVTLLAVPAGIHPTFPPPRDHRRPDLSIPKAHPGPVTLVAYTGDGRLLASAGPDRAVRLWHARPGDPTAGTLARTLEGHGAGGRRAGRTGAARPAGGAGR